MLLLLCLALLGEPPAATLELRAEPAVLYPGQAGQLVLELRRPDSFAFGASPPRLLVPWLEGDLPALVGELEPEQWLCSELKRPGGGVAVLLGPATWSWPEERSRRDRQVVVHRHVWRFRVAPDAEGMLHLPTAQLLLADGNRLHSSALALEIRRLPAPDQPLPAWRLGVGPFTLRSELSSDRLAPGGETDLRLWVAGEGDLAAVTAPPLARLPGWGADRFRVTPLPETWSEDKSRRCFRWRVQVRSEAGTATLPPIEATFFNPQTGRHEVAAAAPAPVTLAAEPPVPTVPSAGEVPVALRLRPLRADADESALRDWALLLPLVVFGGCVFWKLWLMATRRRRFVARVACEAEALLADLKRSAPLRAAAALQLLTPLPEPQRREAERLLVAAERSNFGPPPPADAALLDQARQLVRDWKEAACR